MGRQEQEHAQVRMRQVPGHASHTVSRLRSHPCVQQVDQAVEPSADQVAQQPLEGCPLWPGLPCELPQRLGHEERWQQQDGHTRPSWQWPRWGLEEGTRHWAVLPWPVHQLPHRQQEGGSCMRVSRMPRSSDANLRRRQRHTQHSQDQTPTEVQRHQHRRSEQLHSLNAASAVVAGCTE